MRLLAFVLSLFCLVFSCFAYDIKPYSGEYSAQSDRVINLVFCPLNYQNNDDSLKDMDVIIQRLSKVKPFHEFMRNIGFYYIVLSEEEENLIFKPMSGFPPLKLRRDFLEVLLAKLKSNYKLIIIDAGGSVSCAELSSPDKMSLIVLGKKRYKDESSFAKGFLHELGHSFGLRDECVDCQQLSLAGQPNCASTKEEAQNWWGELVGEEPRVNYISGCCGNKSYIRPTIASLMNDPERAEDFGPVNERYLRKILDGLREK